MYFREIQSFFIEARHHSGTLRLNGTIGLAVEMICVPLCGMFPCGGEEVILAWGKHCEYACVDNFICGSFGGSIGRGGEA